MNDTRPDMNAPEELFWLRGYEQAVKDGNDRLAAAKARAVQAEAQLATVRTAIEKEAADLTSELLDPLIRGYSKVIARRLRAALATPQPDEDEQRRWESLGGDL